MYPNQCSPTRKNSSPPFEQPRLKPSSPSAFFANYQTKYTRQGWKRIQHRLVQRMIGQFSHRENEQIHLVPTQLNLDPVNGYPVNNGVQPNAHGYGQIGVSFYSWMKSVL